MKKLICIHSTRDYFTVGKEYTAYGRGLEFICDDAVGLPWLLNEDKRTKLPMLCAGENDVIALFREIEEKQIEEKPKDGIKVVCTFCRDDAPYWTVGKEYDVVDGNTIFDDEKGNEYPWSAFCDNGVYRIMDFFAGKPLAEFEEV